jgi:2-dehydro-3-deoxygalactonokinase
MRAQRGDVLHSLFGVRSLALFQRMPQSALPAYLSGLLIGEEFRSAMQAGPGITHIVLVGDATLCERYAQAAKILGLNAEPAPSASGWRGMHLVAKAAGLA